MLINWYPGHMAKTKRQLQEQISRCDLILELCDARLPFSSRNPDLEKLIQGKKSVLLLNKSDLADADLTREWIRSFTEQGIRAFPCSAQSGKSKSILRVIDDASREFVEKALAKGVRKVVRAMIVGVPNVGKSTLINQIHGSSVARTGDRPGVTKANQWVTVSPYLQLMDSPGMLWPRLDDQTAARRLCYIGSIKDDVVDLPMLTIELLQELMEICPQAVSERFRIRDFSLRGESLLQEVCKGRGFLLKGGLFDYDRCCQVVLDEFRAGRCGRITLEKPDTSSLKEDTHVEKQQDGPCS